MRTVAKLQAVSGVVFAVFLGLHLVTTASAMGGPEVYDRVLNALRKIYRPHIAVEVMLIGLPAGVHVVCAAIRIVRRSKTSSRTLPGLRMRLHRWAGYFLLAIIGGHVFATRLMPTLASGPTATGHADFAYLAYSVLAWPFLMGPYYVLLGIAGAVHLLLGLGLALRILAPRAAATGLLRGSAAGAMVVALLVTGGVAVIILRSGSSTRTRFAEYADLYERWLPFMSALSTESPESPRGQGDARTK
jgi:succinate dehydrogenase/fumarate reductase cytochrome b subunit